jgi:hypothetical protein
MTQESLATGATGILRGQRLPDPVFVTRPRLPPLEAFAGLLGGVWERRHLTNFGPLHERLEAELRARLGARQLHLTNNGMTGLMIALLALELPPGEILTTPFTFPATVHAIRLAGHVPVFCDLAADSYNLDPDAVEAQLTPSTVAILAVHTFGTACDTSLRVTRAPPSPPRAISRSSASTPPSCTRPSRAGRSSAAIPRWGSESTACAISASSTRRPWPAWD